VKKRDGFPSKTSDLRDRVSLRAPAPGPVLETLETRLEAGLAWPLFPEFPHAAPGQGPLPRVLEDPCGCWGTLCLCDGQDCAGICLRHCVLDYA